MPKEITYSDQPAFLQMPDGNEYPEGSSEAEANKNQGGLYRRRGVQVTWLRDRNVEIGTASFDISKQRAAEGMFLSLDRAGLSKLIKDLQKAGRQAFGTDPW